MDETTCVSELRADAPVPDRVRLAPGRQRLLDATAAGGRIRGLRSDWRTGAVGAVVAITVAAVAATLLVGGEGRDKAPTSLLSEAGEVGSAREVLLAAATMVEDDPVPHPGTKQWVYTREITYNASTGESSGITFELDPGEEPPLGSTPTGIPGMGKVAIMAGPGPHETEGWVPFSDPAAEKGKNDDDYSPREIFAFLDALPDDQEKVLDKVRTFYPRSTGVPDSPVDDVVTTETPEEHEFRALGLLVAGQPVHPEGLAKVYRAMAEIPGIKASRVRDVVGRETVAIARKGREGADTERYLLDPATGLPAGQESLAGTGSPMTKAQARENGQAFWKKGDLMMADLVLESALVSKDHERP